MDDRKQKLQEYVETLEEIKKRKEFFSLEDFRPYPKQLEFFNAGAFDERMFAAGNQRGKTQAGAFEIACHLTGIYPEWWKGRRFDRAVSAWACGESWTDVRDTAQTKLLGIPGVPELLGTGLIPRSKLVGPPAMRSGVPDSVDTVHVRHKSGGISILNFKAYEQTYRKFMGRPMDVIWLDEEPNMEIYSECLARTIHTKGMLYITNTPIHGQTELVDKFFNNTMPKFRTLIHMTKFDAPVPSAEDNERSMAKFPKWEWDSRLNGEPMQGEGRVFSLPREAVVEPATPLGAIPESWTKLWGIDFGISDGHPFAAVLIFWDRDKDVIHVHDAYKMSGADILHHVVRMKQVGINVPVAWPHDGDKHIVNTGGGSTGEQLAALYKKAGVKMCPTHATFPGGGYNTEAGVLELEQRFISKRLIIASHLTELLDEYRNYHRKDGLIVKKNDDLLSALRIAVMGRRDSKCVVLGDKRPDPRMNGNGGMALNAELSGDDLF